MDEFSVTFEMEKSFVLGGAEACVDIDGSKVCSFPIKSGGSQSVKIKPGAHKMVLSLNGKGKRTETDILVNQDGTIRLKYDKASGKPTVDSLGMFAPNVSRTHLDADGKIRLEERDEEFLVNTLRNRPIDAAKVVREMTGADLKKAKEYVDDLFARESETGNIDSDFDAFYKRIRSLPGADVFGTKKEVKHLQSILLEGEVVNAVSSGLMNDRTWLMASTNKRVLLVNKNMLVGMQQMEVPLNHINAITYTTGIVFSTIIITHGASSMKIEQVAKGSEKYFVEATNKAIREYGVNVNIVNPQPTQQSTSAPFSAADEIRKFKELLDMGAITQEEFDAKKKQLLGI